MVSANPSLSRPQPPFSWSLESALLKQGIKIGLAGTITYAIYEGWHLPQGYWAVFTALVVTQANLGASWKAALYRTIGSACGAVAAALLVPLVGNSAVGLGVLLFLLASFFGYLAALHPAFSAAGFTAAIILVLGGIAQPWHEAWLRVLYTTEGSLVALAVCALIWPVRAREMLRQKIASILEGSAELYRALAAAAIEGVDNEQELHQLDRRLHELRRGITQQMDEARSELSFSRFNESAYQSVVELADQVRRRLTAMTEDSSLYMHAHVEPGLVPSLPKVADTTAQYLTSLAHAVRTPGRTVDSVEIDAAVNQLNADLAKLRAQRRTTPFALDRMLPFWALVFNLREVTQDLKQVQAVLPLLG